MEDTKSKWASRGIWGGVVTVLASVAGIFFEVAVEQDTQDQVTQGAVDVADAVSRHDWPAVVSGLVALAGGAVAIYGRYQATKQLR